MNGICIDIKKEQVNDLLEIIHYHIASSNSSYSKILVVFLYIIVSFIMWLMQYLQNIASEYTNNFNFIYSFRENMLAEIFG